MKTVKELKIRHKEALQEFILQRKPALYLSSRTSTVIPYEFIQKFIDLSVDDFYLCDLSEMPEKIERSGDNIIEVSGPVTWERTFEFCQKIQKKIKVSPTENLATILGGVATSATGERSFGHGTLRDQIQSVSFFNYRGEEKKLQKTEKVEKYFIKNLELLKNYQKVCENYQSYKNAPFPLLNSETDLLIGSEGQLGVISGTHLIVQDDNESVYFLAKLPAWTDDFHPHLEFFEKVQNFRGKIISCELIDSQSKKNLNLFNDYKKNDFIYLEIEEKYFEEIAEDFIYSLELLTPEDFLQVKEKEIHNLRLKVPQKLHEILHQKGCLKRGTDVQIHAKNFEDLLSYYKLGTKLGLPYYLFGHFGDAHLHLNFIVEKDQEEKLNEYFTTLYENVYKWQGSPFAEHGIGLLKKPYVQLFYSEIHKEMFRYLKEKFDPYSQFFPQGFMTV